MLLRANRALNKKSLWYQYKVAVWPKDGDEPVTEQAKTMHSIMRAVRAIRTSGELGYVSIPITTGGYYYEALRENPAVPVGEIISKIAHENYLRGLEFVQTLLGKCSYPLIFPADLVPSHQEWEQRHFQALWLSIIAEKCTDVHMGPGWHLSNGGCEEFTHVMQLRLGLPHPVDFFRNTKESEKVGRDRMRNIRVFDEFGRTLTIERGIECIEKGHDWLGRNKFTSKKLERCIELLHWTKSMIGQGFYQ